MNLQELHLAPLVVGISFGICSIEPIFFQYAMIIGLIALSGIFAISSGVGAVAIASTILTMIASGASIDAIWAALAAHIIATTGSLEALAQLIAGIYRILGC